MFGLNKSFLKFIVNNSKCLVQIRNSSKHIGLHSVILRNREDKLMFGKVIETKKEKKKRLEKQSMKHIPSEIIIKHNTKCISNVDSELMWIKRTSRNLRIFSSPETENNQLNLNYEKFDCKKKHITIEQKSCDKLNKCKNSVKLKNKSHTEIVSLEESLERCLKVKKEIGCSEKFLQQLLKFPIFEKHKSSNEEWTKNSKILTHSVYNDNLGLEYPTVTRILSSTMTEESKTILENWKVRMIEKLGLDGFDRHQAETLEEGTLFHSAVMNKLTEQAVVLADKIKPTFSSLDNVFQEITKIRAIESDVVHPVLKYRGKFDCVAYYRGTLCLIDWKKSSKKKFTISSTFDAPFQMASYIGALNYDLKYPFQIKKGLIVVAYTDGQMATVHEIEENLLYYYWQMWLQRLKQYYSNLSVHK